MLSNQFRRMRKPLVRDVLSASEHSLVRYVCGVVPDHHTGFWPSRESPAEPEAALALKNRRGEAADWLVA